MILGYIENYYLGDPRFPVLNKREMAKECKYIYYIKNKSRKREEEIKRKISKKKPKTVRNCEKC